MTAISTTWTAKTASDWDPQKPLTTTKLNALYNNTTFLMEWLGASYRTGAGVGAVQDHNHDGSNSAYIPTGANPVRNGSFESGTSGLTTTAYTGGTLVVQESGAMHGRYCMKITSTVLANGGGSFINDEYFAVSPQSVYRAAALFKGSIAGISSSITLNWYNSAKSLVSSKTATSSSTPTSATWLDVSQAAPSGAAYGRVEIVGGVPATGTAVGDITVDGLRWDDMGKKAVAGTELYPFSGPALSLNNSASTEVSNCRVKNDGTYRVIMSCKGYDAPSGGLAAVSILGAQINGTGALYASGTDLPLIAGDTVQMFVAYTAGVDALIVPYAALGVSANGGAISMPLVSLPIGER